MLAIVILSSQSQSIWSWFTHLTWNNVLSAFVVLGTIAATVVPYIDASWFRGFLIAFIAVSLKLQNLGNAQEIKRVRTMMQNLNEQNYPSDTPIQPLDKQGSRGL